nr:reverse transcriptase domain-containing protein [Tanacetum cinerariifolium]
MPIRYVSWTLHEAERHYAPFEKLAYSYITYPEGYDDTSTRLIKVITDQPIKQILNKPKVLGKLAKYAMELGAYNITYIPRTAIKGQILVDFINKILAGTQYVEMNGQFVERNKAMVKYLAKAKKQAALFKKFSIKNIPRNQNQKVDVLSKLASIAFNHLTKEILVEVLNSKSIDVQEVIMIVEEEEDNWMTPIIKCLEEGVSLTDKNEARTLRMKIGQSAAKELHNKEGAGRGVRDACESKAYQMMLKTSNRETPFSLTYGIKDVISAEIGIPTYQTIPFNESQNEEEMRLNMDLSQERRETAAIRKAKYKKKVEQYYNKRVCPMSFKVGDFVC